MIGLSFGLRGDYLWPLMVCFQRRCLNLSLVTTCISLLSYLRCSGLTKSWMKSPSDFPMVYPFVSGRGGRVTNPTLFENIFSHVLQWLCIMVTLSVETYIYKYLTLYIIPEGYWRLSGSIVDSISFWVVTYLVVLALLGPITHIYTSNYA